MLTNGFVRYKGIAYVRWNEIDVLEYVIYKRKDTVLKHLRLIMH